MSRARGILGWTVLMSSICLSPVRAGEGTLFIIGGGLRADNAALFDRLLSAGGGAKQCRVAIFGTASISIESAEYFSQTLQRHEVPADNITVLNIRPDNAATTAHDPQIVELLGKCTIAYFVGGDQRRITQALLQADGADTPVLAAVRKLLERGGVVAGSSAGAAMQSRVMIAIGGLPDSVLDEGLDPLDFGVSTNPHRPGLTATPGLAFFSAGIIDQHFNQFRGRLGRLSRALIAAKTGYGFGVDENTALIVPPSGPFEIVGTGCVTIVNATDATCTDGPLGCQLAGLRLSCLQAGDRWDATQGEALVLGEKKLLTIQDDPYRGNYLIPDISSSGAIRHALFVGLADNTSRRQQGLALRYTDTFGHGYRYTFRKTERSQCWGGQVGKIYSRAVHDIDLTIEPILSSLQPPASALPVDLLEGRMGIACQALWFRGILLANSERQLRPDKPITRAELAIALAHSVHLLPPLVALPPIADVRADEWWHDELSSVLEAKLLTLDDRRRFRPEEPISRQDAAAVMLELHRRCGGAAPPATKISLRDETDVSATLRAGVFAAVQQDLLQTTDERFRPADPLTRSEAARAIYRSLALPW